jgi:hypothetical protein
MAELEADIDARELRAIDGTRGRGGSHQNFDACVRGGVSGGRSKEGGASLLGAVCVKSCHFQASSPLVGEYVRFVRSGRGYK